MGWDNVDGTSSRAAVDGIARDGAVDTRVEEILEVVWRGGRGSESGDWAFWMNELMWLRGICQLRVWSLKTCPRGRDGDGGGIELSSSTRNHLMVRMARDSDESPPDGKRNEKNDDRGKGCEVVNVVRHGGFRWSGDGKCRKVEKGGRERRSRRPQELMRVMEELPGVLLWREEEGRRVVVGVDLNDGLGGWGVCGPERGGR